MTAAIPAGIQAIGSFAQGRAESDALKAQGRQVQRTALANEAQQRRSARQVIGSAAAAGAQAGGVDEGTLRQSLVNAELDALNIRYGGIVEKDALNQQAKNVRRESAMLAGGQLLGGVGNMIGARGPKKPKGVPVPRNYPTVTSGL